MKFFKIQKIGIPILLVLFILIILLLLIQTRNVSLNIASFNLIYVYTLI